LAASVTDEAGWSTFTEFGELRLHARSNPILQVVSVLVGRDPYNLTAVTDLTQVLLDPWQITVPARRCRLLVLAGVLVGVAGAGFGRSGRM